MRNAHDQDVGLSLGHFLLNKVVLSKFLAAKVDKHV